MSDRNLISVIMNCYNGETFLKDAINSVFQQTHENWEIIFFDNCSTDNSKKIACSYGPKVTYVRSGEFLSLGCARREALKYAKGEWIGFLDADDLWYPNKLSDQISLVKNGNVALVYSGIDNIDVTGRIISHSRPKPRDGKLLDTLLNHFDINMVTPLINRQFLVDNSLTFNGNIHASEEYNLFLRIAAKGVIKSVPDIHGAYRVYQGSLTDKKISRWAIDRLTTLRQLNSENKNLRLYNNPCFIRARMHASYYSARYYMSVGNFRKAKHTLFKIRSYRFVYFVLWATSHFPSVWEFIHKRSIKIYISNIITK
ncbi:glycosyltransferase family 2 protein [bacterium]|nr:glycosyltransferase family 2 protein [bacterium]